MIRYVALLHEGRSEYGVSFPDFPGVVSGGATPDEALAEAAEALVAVAGPLAGFAALLGIPSAPLEIDLARDVIFRSLTLQGINGRRMFDTWYKSRALLKAGLDVSPVITHRLSLWEGFHEGMELMMEGKCGKVILIP